MRQHPWELSTDRLIQVDSFFFSLHVRESGNLLLVESGILEVILLMESGILSFGIRNTVHDWNPESKFY